MPIDPSIPLSVRPPEVQSPLEAQLRGLQVRSAQQQVASNAALEQERQQKVAQQQRLQAQNDTIDHLMASSLKTDPDTGVATFDRPTFEQGLIGSNLGHLYPVMSEQLDKLDQSAARINGERRQLLARSIFTVQQAGNTPEAVLSAAAYLKKNGAITDEHLQPILQSIAADPSPANVGSLMTKLGAGLPEYRDLVNAEQKRQADLAAQAAKTRGEQATAAKTEAEVAGTLPLTPAQKLEAQQRAAQIAQENRRATETERHNRATETAANPFAALSTPPPAGAGGPGPGGAPAPGGAPPAGAPPGQGLTGEAFLQAIAQRSPGLASEVKAYAEGRRPFPAGFALKSPYFQSLIQMVGQYDPTFDAANYNARNKARMDLTSPSGTGGKTINALNTALQHAGKLSDLIETLNNFGSPYANAVYNPLRTAVGSTAVTNYQAVAPQLAKEIERAWRGAGGSTADIKDLIDTIGSNLGKQQQREALGQFVDLLKGKMDATEQQRDNIMGPAGKDIPVLFDQNRSILAKIDARANGQAAGAAPAPKEGDTKPIDGYPGTEQTYRGGKWIRTK